MASVAGGYISDVLRKAKLCELFRRKDKAEELYKELMLQFPEDFRAFFNCARLLSDSVDRIEEALNLFITVIRIDKAVIETYGAIAGLLIKQNRPAAAVSYCRVGLSLNCSDKACIYNINVALRQIGCIEDAINLSWVALSNEPLGSVDHDPISISNAPCPSPELTIVCVKWGKKYSSEYVNNLYAGMKRNVLSNCTFHFVCYTDDASGIRPEVHCQPFATDTQQWQGWWLKAQVFSPQTSFYGWTLYIDLDTVICGSLECLFDLVRQSREKETSTSFYTLNVTGFRNEARPEGMNSSLILWDARQARFHALYHYLVQHYGVVTQVIYKFDHYLEMMLLAHTRPGLEEAGAAMERGTSSRVSSAEGALFDKIAAGGTAAGEDLLVRAKRPACARNSMMALLGSGGRDGVHEGKSEEEERKAAGRVEREVFCAYLQDACPGRVVDYFAAQEVLAGQTHLLKEPVSQKGSREALAEDEKADEAGAAGPAIVCFPLRPKPHELLRESWVRVHWQGSSAECFDEA